MQEIRLAPLTDEDDPGVVRPAATLGRGGTDLTATLMGRALGAREVMLWKDVPGMLTADPRVVHPAGFEELVFGSQKPPQHSVPLMQPWPSPLQGSRAQKPRMARLVSTWPVRWKAGWLGSLPGWGCWAW